MGVVKKTTPKVNHGLRNVPSWERMSERKRTRLAAKEAVSAVSDIGTDFRNFIASHNELVTAHNHLKRAHNALQVDFQVLRALLIEQAHTHAARGSWLMRQLHRFTGFTPMPSAVYEQALSARYSELQRLAEQRAREAQMQEEAALLLSVEDAWADAQRRLDETGIDARPVRVELCAGGLVDGYVATPPQIRAAHLVLWDLSGHALLYPLEDVLSVTDGDGEHVQLTEGGTVAGKEADDVTTDSSTKQQEAAEQVPAASASM